MDLDAATERSHGFADSLPVTWTFTWAPEDRRTEMQAMLAEWEDTRARLRESERSLTSAIERYRFGEGPSPDAIVEQVERLRSRCAAQMRLLLATAHAVA